MTSDTYKTMEFDPQKIRDLGCLPFSRKNRLVESSSKWDSSKPRMEISMGCACSISTDISTGTNAIRKALNLVEKSKWNAYFPFAYSGWEFWTTSEDVPFISEIFQSGNQNSLPFTFEPKFPDFLVNDKHSWPFS